MSNILKSKNTAITTGFASEQDKTRFKDALGEAYLEAADSSVLFGKDEKTNIGIVRAFAKEVEKTVPCLLNKVLGDGAIVEINPSEPGLAYREEIAGEDNKIISIESETDKLGYGNGRFIVKTNFAVRGGDVLSNDYAYGGQIMVDKDETVEPLGDGTYQFVGRLTDDNFDSFEEKSNWINKVVEIANNFRGELDTNAAAPFVGDLRSKTISRLFRIGDGQQLEISHTDKAGAAMSSSTGNQKLSQIFENRMNAMKDKSFIIGMADISSGSPALSKAYEVKGLYYALVEGAMQFASNALWSSDGIDIAGANGNRVYAPKGLLKQAITECYNIKYGNNTEFRIGLQKASDYVFKGIPVESRYMEIECGNGFEQRLFNEFMDSFKRTNPFLMTPDMTPQKLFEGRDNMNITYNPIAIKSTFLSGIGWVKTTHRPEMDYTSGSPRFSSNSNRARTTNSGLILNARALYNASSAKSKGRIVDQMSYPDEYKGSNIVLIKDAGDPMINFGYEKGRSQKHGGEGSSHKYEHTNYATVGRLGATFVDKSAVVYFEMAEN